MNDVRSWYVIRTKLTINTIKRVSSSAAVSAAKKRDLNKKFVYMEDLPKVDEKKNCVFKYGTTIAEADR